MEEGQEDEDDVAQTDIGRILSAEEGFFPSATSWKL